MLRSIFQKPQLDFTEAYYQAQKAYNLEPGQDFVRVKNRIGMTAATAYAQIYFSKQNLYKKYRRELELHHGERNLLNQDYDVLVVLPPSGSVPQQSLDILLKQSMGLATSAGFASVSQVQLSTNSVLLGAKRLKKRIFEKQQQGRKLLLVSYSFGSAFVRVMLDHSTSEETRHIVGWANLSGLIFGSPRFHCSDKKSLFQGDSYREFSCEQKYFSKALQTHRIKTVHFLGMKNNETLTSKEIKDREFLKAWGPNDGLLCFSSYQNLNQMVVPLLDQGHLIDLSRMGETFVNTLSAMVSTLPMPRSMPEPVRGDLDFL